MNVRPNGKGRTILDFMRDYLIPPTCAGCGERLEILAHEPLCDVCRPRFEEEKRERCGDCGLSFLDCVCLPPLLREIGIRDGIFLAPYHSGRATVTDHLVYRIKSERDTSVFRFLAKELSHPVRAYFRAEEIPAEDVIVVPLPRRRRAVRENGFDQARVLAAALADALECTYSALLLRHRDGREQKELNAKERLQNLKRAFRLKGTPDLSGKTVLLVDDVVTTGSGLRVAAELLFTCGADRVVPVTVARTVNA